MSDYKLIGKNYRTPDLVAKVTGRAKYAEDFRAEGMLFCRQLLSPEPHARVRHIDANFNHGCCYQDVELTALEHPHDLLFQFGVEPAMEQSDLQIRERFIAKFLVHLERRFEFTLLAFFDHGVCSNRKERRQRT